MEQESKIRYSRQMSVKEIGKEGQQIIQKSSCMIIGCGALGSMIAMQLAGAGVKRIGIADFDTIDISNLQRQFFFKSEEAGLYKTNVIKQRINELNPEIQVEIYNFLITLKKAEEIFPYYDIIIDATDNPATKEMVAAGSSLCKKNCIVGGVSGFRGQVAVLPAEGADYKTIFDEITDNGILPCELEGVVGPVAGFCASLQANETLKLLVRAGNMKNEGNASNGYLIAFDLLKDSFVKIFL